MAKRPAAPRENVAPPSTRLRIERIRKPQWERKRQRFALGYDRRAESNVNFTDPKLHRTWRGKAPIVDDGKLSTRKPQALDSAQYLYTNDAQIYNVPEGFIGVQGGIVPVSGTVLVPDDQQGYPTDSPTNIDDDWDNSNSDPSEYFHQRFPKPEGQYENLPYNPYNPELVRVVWENVSYTSPTYPEVRYPNGGFRKRNNKYI